ncbi:MAG: NAD-dependent succinate-semialdehyde dehydrogenase [Opitutaceae bacterium]|nr:NAD-dependent succinate-semialdehyde dehydrogenase [Opitutaceae bacterium]
MTFASIDPTTGRRCATHRKHRASEIELSLKRATAAQRVWRDTPIDRRTQVLRRLGRELLAARDDLAPLATTEMGKPLTQARAEVEKCALLCAYYADQGPRILADDHPPGAPAHTRVTFEPLGTVLAIMPWNFPFWQVVRAAVPVLIGGNAVLLKPAATVVGCTLALERIFARAGLPPGVFQLLLADNAAIARVLADPRVHGVTLTGSTVAGKKVAALAGAAMKPGVFELGGSDPAIVLADADLPRAAEICAQSRLLNSGQSCVCAKRFLVERSVLPAFERLLVARMAARRMGDPADPATEVGPLARADLRATLHAQVKRSVSRGARVLRGGAPAPGQGFFYPPTVLTDVRPGMPAFDEELFGPVAAIVPVRDAAEAVRLANATPYGLAATVFTRNAIRARRLAREIEAGAVFVNDFVRSAPELPFGGVKQSGHGRELGPWGARAFVNVKTVWGA